MKIMEKFLAFGLSIALIRSLLFPQAAAQTILELEWQDLDSSEPAPGGAASLREEFNGRPVRFSGYLLPLDYSGTAITEFLLVPEVGVCLHTPCVPPAQIIHVQPDQGVEIRGVFDPVRVTGVLFSSPTTYALTLFPGTGGVEALYTMKASQVELY